MRFLIMSKKTYVCHANNECVYNKQGACNSESNVVTIAVYDGVAVCPNFIPIDDKKLVLIEGLYQVLIDLLLKEHGDEMEEDIRDYDLCTSPENTVFIEIDGGDHMQDIAVEVPDIVAVVDTINILKYGRSLRVKEAG